MKNYQFLSLKNYLTTYNSIIELTNSEISSIKPTNNITIDYIECIIPYHNSCIHICNNLLKFARKEFIINFTKELIKIKRAEIEELKLINHTTYGFINPEKNVKIYLEDYFKIFKELEEKKLDISNTSIFLNFKSEIFNHFKFGEKMTRNVLHYYIDPRLRIVAENSIKNYIKLNEQLKNL